MRMKKLLSLFLALVMVLSLVPTTAFATGTEEDVVYLSISFDGKYIDDQNGDPIVYMPIPLETVATVDLAEYGLENMLFEGALNDDGSYKPTALQLLIYAHEEIYGGDWSEVNFDALPGSSYFKGGIFGFTENLVYFHNGDFPVDETQASEYMTVGATSDRIVLEAGDFLDVASFGCYSFLWDQNGGFHLFADPDGNYVHDYAAETGEALTVKVKHSFCDLMFGNSWVKDKANYTVYYGSTFGEAEGSVTTNDEGNAEITFSDAGTYYVWCDGDNGDDTTHTGCDYYMENGEPCIVSSPAYAKVTVTGAANVAVTGITLNTDAASLKVGETVTLSATVAPDNATNPTVTWTSSNSGVATVADGVVTAVAAGTATITATAGEKSADCTVTVTAAPRVAQDVSAVLNATLAMQTTTVAQPSFGTNYGEWTVFGLARGGYAVPAGYYEGYYSRIVEYVNEKAAKINLSGALDKNKSTDNSRLIMALASIGKDATSVGNWDLVEAYSANGINWIKKQGMNGTIWTLIALDCGGYETSDPTIRQQCVDAIVAAQHNDGGWSLVTAKAQPSNVDITGMTLTALYPYRDQPAVAAACETALNWLSKAQLDNGGFPYGKGETSESCVWAIVAATTWGINPDTDPRFIKNGYSAVDNLLTYYLEDEAKFEHGRGAGANAMATDQATYGLVAYDRLVKNQPALYDYSDVEFEESTVVSGKPKVTLGLPEEVTNDVGTVFNANVSIDQWESGYKLLDMVMSVPAGLKVNAVTATRLDGGSMSYHLDSDGKLRLVYFDEGTNKDITIDSNASGNAFPAELFTIEFEVETLLEAETLLEITIDGMSLKASSDSLDVDSQLVMDTTEATGEVKVVEGISYSAKQLYQGDGIDLIPQSKMAVAVAVTGLEEDAAAPKLTFNNGSGEILFLYSEEMHEKSGVHTYVALVDASIDMKDFAKEENFTLNEKTASAAITFGDADANGTINAQDALNAVNFWLRKNAPADNHILAANVNGDSRLNTYDALGIVEHFVNGSEFAVVTMALSLKPTTNNP